MDRVKINLPNEFSFCATIAIRISDVNYGGHVGNDSFLSLMQEARLQYFKNFEYSETNVEGVGTIMADAAIEYKSELFYGDTINVYITARNISKFGFDLFYKIENASTKIVVAKAKTGILCFNYAERKLELLPQKAIEKLSK